MNIDHFNLLLGLNPEFPEHFVIRSASLPGQPTYFGELCLGIIGPVLFEYRNDHAGIAALAQLDVSASERRAWSALARRA